MPEEQRSFSRVAVRIKAQARKTRGLDEPTLFQGITALKQSPMQGPLLDSKLPEELVRFLVALDAKLDMLLGLAGRDMLFSDFPLTLTVTEISGAGLKFTTPDPVAAGDCMEVILTFSHIPLQMIGVTGRVASPDPVSGEWRFEFVNLDEGALEAVVQFVFQEQRKQIRTQKLT